MMNKKLPKLKIVNSYGSRAVIQEKRDYFKLIIIGLKVLLLLMIMITCLSGFYYSKLYYQENNFLKEKLLSSVSFSGDKKDNILLNTVAEIIARDGKIPKEMAKNYAIWIFESAYQNKIDPLLILAVMSVESNYDFKAVSNANAIGLMQVIYDWHKEKIASKADLFDPKMNIQTGAKILREYLNRSDSELEALLRYNGSLGQTPIYALKVSSVKQKFNLEILRAITKDV